MKPKTRIDIIVGKLKPMADKPSVRAERPADKMQSSDFVQEIDMSDHDVMKESCGEAIIQAVKQGDAKALADALCDLIELHENSSEEYGGAGHDFNEGGEVSADSEEE